MRMTADRTIANAVEMVNWFMTAEYPLFPNRYPAPLHLSDLVVGALCSVAKAPGLAQSKTWRSFGGPEHREASWTAVVLYRFG